VKPWPLGLTAVSWSPWYPQTNHYNDITSMDQHLYKSCIIYLAFGHYLAILWDLSGRHFNPNWRFRSVSTQHQLPATWSSRTRNRCPLCPDFKDHPPRWLYGYNMGRYNMGMWFYWIYWIGPSSLHYGISRIAIMSMDHPQWWSFWDCNRKEHPIGPMSL
jgi:hypothetical protein